MDNSMNPTKEQYTSALHLIVALARKSKAINPSLLRRFIDNEVVHEFYCPSNFVTNAMQRITPNQSKYK